MEIYIMLTIWCYVYRMQSHFIPLEKHYHGGEPVGILGCCL